MRKIMMFIALFGAPQSHAITFIGEDCEPLLTVAQIPYRKFPEATLIDSDELSALMEKAKVELPRTNLRPGVMMSDRARAHDRKLQNVFPALLHRKLKIQISYDDGQNGHIFGAIRKIEEVGNHFVVTVSLESFRPSAMSPPELSFRADWITALNGINVLMPSWATRNEIESVRALRATERSLLGKFLTLGQATGVLIASHMVVGNTVMYGVETTMGRIDWVSLNPEQAPNFEVKK